MVQDHSRVHSDFEKNRHRERLNPPQRLTQESNMSSNELIELAQNLGPVFVICLVSFRFIKYQSDLMAKIQDEFNKKFADNDNRLFTLVERSNEAMLKMVNSLKQNTKSVDSLITTIGRKN